MKKQLLVVALAMTLVLLFATFANAENTLKIGYNFSPQNSYNSTTLNVQAGLDVAYEYTIASSDALGYGFGVQYQLEKAFTDTAANKFTYIPVYALITYDFAKSESFNPYVTARLGYNLFTPNDAYKGAMTVGNGLYYAAGVGAKFDQFKAEVLYEVNNGTLDSVTVTDSAIALKLGITF